MLRKLIDHSEDLKKLRDEGFEIQIVGSFLILHNIPYVNTEKEVQFGQLISELTIAEGVAGKPKNHVVYFIGSQPCHADGSEIQALVHSKSAQTLGNGIVVDRSFSNKPKEGFGNYYDKMSSYSNIIEAPAHTINPSMSSKTFVVHDIEEYDGPLVYPDTNSSRSNFAFMNEKLKGQKVAIIGLGGTGSYILDLVAKTPVDQITLFDGDKFYLHNAFRSPGAPTIDEVNASTYKVNRFGQLYSRMHRAIEIVPEFMSKPLFERLSEMTMVFICIDDGETKRDLIKYLCDHQIAFIDVGIGVDLVDENLLLGQVRVTSSNAENYESFVSKNRISFSNDGKNEYSSNIQIAELNSLNASLAVIKWKKSLGFYFDAEKESHSVFLIEDNSILNADQSE